MIEVLSIDGVPLTRRSGKQSVFDVLRPGQIITSKDGKKRLKLTQRIDNGVWRCVSLSSKQVMLGHTYLTRTDFEQRGYALE